MNKLISFISACLLTSVVCADPVTVPNAFSTGTPAKASEVNANFTALANAVNAIPKPLGLYDSTGKRIGDFILAGATDGQVLITSLSGYEITNPIWVAASSVGFFWRWSGNKFTQSLYYTTNDCSGEVYMGVTGELRVGWPVSPTPVSSTSGLVMHTNSPLTILVRSQREVDRFWDGSPPIYSACRFESSGPGWSWSPYSVSNLMPVSQAAVIDLSVFTPPFSVH